MERSAPFVKWEEVYSTNRKGRREVRYYLKRRNGDSVLAIVGKEKKLKISSSSLFRYRYDKSLFLSSNLPLGFPSKLRSRREVVDLLSSLVKDACFSRPHKSADGVFGAEDALEMNLEKFEDVQLHKISQHVTEYLWVGPCWTCRKKRKHYEAYTRSGIRISVHNFVYVLAEMGKRLVAYLDDLYEDSKGNKMCVVRWFHKVDEVGLDLPNNDKEIFFSLCLQDLSIKCIDGPATVLSPQHYHKFLKLDRAHVKLEPFVCGKLFDDKEGVKPFDITQVKGYFDQSVHSFMSSDDAIGIRPRKRLRRLVGTVEEWGPRDDDQKNDYEIGCEIEVLSQDSGIRGMWFRGVVIKKHKDKLKVRYQDLKDAEDESINLEEWILSSRIAVPDQLGIRHNGRSRIRPARSCKTGDVSFVDVGCVVDAWLDDGWWEGIVIHNESDDKIHVYFPGEKQKSILGCKDLRYSQEWLGNEWKQMKNRPDVVSLILCTNETTNSQTTTKSSHDNLSTLTGMIHEKDVSKDNPLEIVDFEAVNRENLKWNWSTKKRKSSSKNSYLVAVETRKRFLVKVGNGKCKFTSESSLFGGGTKLGMSR